MASNNYCSSVRLDLGKGSVANFPVSDQGDSGACTAYAAALVATGYLRNKAPTLANHSMAPEKIWSHVMAKSEKESAKILDPTLGKTCGLIQQAFKTGSCESTVVSGLIAHYLSFKKNYSSSPSDDKSENSLIHFKNSMRKLYTELKKSPDQLKCSLLRTELSPFELETASLNQIFMQLSFNRDEDALFDIVLSEACKQKGAWVPSQIVAPDCHNFGMVPDKSGKRQKLQSPDNFKKYIHTLLDRPLNNNHPIGIEYCSNVLYGGNDSFITNRNFPMDLSYLSILKGTYRNFSEGCGFHASGIVGREMRNGKIWIDEDILAKNIFRTTTLGNEQ